MSGCPQLFVISGCPQLFVCNIRMPPAVCMHYQAAPSCLYALWSCPHVMSGCPELFWLPSEVVCIVKLPSTVACTAGLPSAVVCTYCLAALSNVVYCLQQQTATKVHWLMWFIHIFTCFHITWFLLLLCIDTWCRVDEWVLSWCVCMQWFKLFIFGVRYLCFHYNNSIIFFFFCFVVVFGFCWTSFYRTKTCIHFWAEHPHFLLCILF